MATPTLSRSLKLWQEREAPEHETTRRLPGPRMSTTANAAHSMPLSPPSPHAEQVRASTEPPPDAGRTTVWPWNGREEIV